MHKSVNYTSWNDMFVMLLSTADWKCFFNVLFENVSFFSFKNKKETSKKMSQPDNLVRRQYR